VYLYIKSYFCCSLRLTYLLTFRDWPGCLCTHHSVDENFILQSAFGPKIGHKLWGRLIHGQCSRLLDESLLCVVALLTSLSTSLPLS